MREEALREREATLARERDDLQEREARKEAAIQMREEALREREATLARERSALQERETALATEREAMRERVAALATESSTVLACNRESVQPPPQPPPPPAQQQQPQQQPPPSTHPPLSSQPDPADRAREDELVHGTRVRVWWTRQMLRGQPDSLARWEHGRLSKQPEVQLCSKKAGTTLRLTVEYDDGQTTQHLLEETHVEIEVRALLGCTPTCI